MDREQLLSQWREEAARGMSGWDFLPHPDGRCTADPLPWDYPGGGAGVPAARGAPAGHGHRRGRAAAHPGPPLRADQRHRGLGAQPGAVPGKASGALGHHRPKEYDSEKGHAPALRGRQLRPGHRPPRKLRPFGGPPGAEKATAFFVTQQVGGERTTCPLVTPAVSWGFLGALWASTWKTSCPGSGQAGFRVMRSRPGLRGEGRYPGRGRRGVPGQRVLPGKFPGFSVEPLPERLCFSCRTQVESPGLCAHPGAPLPHRGEKQKVRGLAMEDPCPVSKRRSCLSCWRCTGSSIQDGWLEEGAAARDIWETIQSRAGVPHPCGGGRGRGAFLLHAADRPKPDPRGPALRRG